MVASLERTERFPTFHPKYRHPRTGLGVPGKDGERASRAVWAAGWFRGSVEEAGLGFCFSPLRTLQAAATALARAVPLKIRDMP